jgi:nitrite reductase (NADH) small subunit
MSEVVVGPLSSIPPGEGRNFEIAGQRVAVFRNRADEVFAVQATCPHKGGPLADGLLGGSTLVCPLHSWKFELTTGAAIVGECGLKTYAVRLDEGKRIVLDLGGR